MRGVSVGRCGSAIGLLLALAIAGGPWLLSCSPNRKILSLEPYQLLVFPGEAALGATAFAVISSNYVPGADAVEAYDLDRSRVGIGIKDAAGVEWPATVRSVFPVQASATSRLAQTRPGAWVTLVLFDLPTNSGIDLGTNPNFLASVIVHIDTVAIPDDVMTGSIHITGSGGQPTTMLWPSLSDLELAPHVMRFRAVRDTDGAGPLGGFPDEPGGTQIAGLEGELVYFYACFANLEVYTGSEASNAGIYLGPESDTPGFGGWFKSRHFVLTDPAGFTLVPPPGGDDDALGEGPLIEVTFDRPNQSLFACTSDLEMMWLWNVYAVRPDADADHRTIADQRGTGALSTTSNLFRVYPIPIPIPQGR